MPTKVSGPKCEGCGRQMGWVELLRTWACRDCGHFLEYVCAHCGSLYDPPVPSCPECDGRIPPNHRLPSDGGKWQPEEKCQP